MVGGACLGDPHHFRVDALLGTVVGEFFAGIVEGVVIWREDEVFAASEPVLTPLLPSSIIIDGL